ncbi:MAG: biopolymer transporter ExbD [Methyloversatilis sp.]|jgi:biopolymer transport protein ExbD|uniref:ExbD/TolR family protein n=1 Tax=Methyloversatilis sp. TaxID=2569862 RepID=UPI0025DD42EF|nr:biopolymer transporter ExbD [Methyloversatilis sp.]MCR6666296.1 biopolymer transporter ExbD [Methyloversatilis sp.]
MNFRRGRGREELEINLIPLIDVLLVILIFLMVTTTYSKTAGLEITLPSAEAPEAEQSDREINVLITARGDILINRLQVAAGNADALAEALAKAASGKQEPVVIISSDKDARLQSSIDVMQAAQRAGIAGISFATQSDASGSR